jgi:hypothetical protein
MRGAISDLPRPTNGTPRLGAAECSLRCSSPARSTKPISRYTRALTVKIRSLPRARSIHSKSRPRWLCRKNSYHLSSTSSRIDLVFSDPSMTPTQLRTPCFLAYASSLRSGQLGRQVGAAIASKSGAKLQGRRGGKDFPSSSRSCYAPREAQS